MLLLLERMLRSGVDVLVGTPGRLQDLINRERLDLTQLSHVILDEVDRMLDMGFADDVDNILKTRYTEGTYHSYYLYSLYRTRYTEGTYHLYYLYSFIITIYYYYFFSRFSVSCWYFF